MTEQNIDIVLRARAITAAAFNQVEKELGLLDAQAKKVKTSGDAMSGMLGKANGLLATFGVGLSVGALMNFGKSLLTTASQIDTLNKATGISTDDLQRLAYVGIDADVSMDELGRAVGTLSERLAGGDQSATDAVVKLGLNLHNLIAAGPKEAFVQIGEAIGRIVDPMEKNAIAADLFGGKLAKNLIPLFGELRDEMAKVPADSIISESQIKQADAMGEAWDRLIIKAKAYSFAVLGGMGLGKEDPKRDIEATVKMLREAGITTGPIFDELRKHQEALAKETRDGAQAAYEYAKNLGVVNGHTLAGTVIDQIHADMKKQLAADTEKATEALKKAKAAISDIENPARDVMHRMHDLTLLGVKEKVDGWSEAFKGLRSRLADIEQQGIPAVFTQGSLGSVGTRVEVPLHISTASWKGTINATMATLPETMKAAFTGGGGISGAMLAMGTEFGEKLFGEKGPLAGVMKSASAGLGKLFGQTLGGILSAAIPGVGALIGPGIELLWGGIKKLFGGPSKEEMAGRGLVEAFEAQIAGMLTAQQRAEAGSDEWKLTVIGVRDAYLKAGKSAEEANAAVERLWASSREGAEASKAAIEEVNRVMTEGQQQAAEVEEAQKVAREAHRAEMQSVLDALDAQRKSLSDAIANEAPEEVMGVIESGMRAQLAVLDAEAAAQRAKMEAEATAIANDLETKIGDIAPDKITVDVGWNPDPFPGPRGGGGDGAATGGLVTDHGIQHFTRGGFVRGMGTDTVPAMLTPGELVLNASQQRAVSALMRGGGSGRLALLEQALAALAEGQARLAAAVATMPADMARQMRDARLLA